MILLFCLFILYVRNTSGSLVLVFADILLLLQGFLHIDEYPPDANQGFDIPSAIISFPDFQTCLEYTPDNTSINSPMVSKMQVFEYYTCKILNIKDFVSSISYSISLCLGSDFCCRKKEKYCLIQKCFLFL